ncbi:MAG: malate dehydrogenase (quinone) [Actinobacteria bacterium]|nr:malate dehydrogenase (quinone) [Actinomycetota bacterium]
MSVSKPSDYDLILVGGGIMTATLAVLLKHLDPELKLVVLERLDDVALESSNAWNNAGTGHAALCELNYMPDDPNGGIPSAAMAISINQQFQESREFWASLVESGVMQNPDSFIHSIPHMTFVRGSKYVDYLKRRFESLRNQPLFFGMEFSDDPKKLASWIPLMLEGRGSERVAATRIEQGTDVDYGEVTNQLFAWLKQSGVEVLTSHEVSSVRKISSGWQVSGRTGDTKFSLSSPKVFIGAGGWALKLLQNSRIPEIKGYGTFPVSGHFLKTENPELIAKHQAKVYSQAAVGAPPMSVPHLDTRVIAGRTSLLFGPFAGLNFKFLKHGSLFDLPLSIRPANILPYLSVAIKNFSLVIYLVKEILKSPREKLESLREFVPTASSADWELYEAGQRAQVIKPAGVLGSLQFGTEVICSADGSIAGLLGASPGASVAVRVMLDVAARLYEENLSSWEPAIRNLVPSYGLDLNSNADLAEKSLRKTAAALKLKA